jgi:outer membrane protein assembly factor BamD
MPRFIPQSLFLKYTTRVLIVTCAALALSGCLFKKNKEPVSGAQEFYDKAYKALQKDDYQTSIELYEVLEARFPFSAQAKQGQLDLISAHYKNREPESVIDSARQFERENPSHPRVDYAIYMRGMALFSGEKGTFHKLFKVDLSKRPPKDARDSYSAFSELLRRYPNSQYTPDARQRMIFLRNRVAEHENHIATYYYKRGAYAAAISRAGYAVQVFDGAPTTSNSLQIMANSYRKLGMYDLARDTEVVLENSFPEMVQARQEKFADEPWYQFW